MIVKVIVKECIQANCTTIYVQVIIVVVIVY